MNTWQALILGIVEGITEYLPVSSTGHLLLTQRILGIPSSESADAFAISIQAGAILAVLFLYFNRVRSIALGALGKSPQGFRLGLRILVAFLPAAIIGLFFENGIKRYLFGGNTWGLWPILLAWLLGGIAILVVDRWKLHHRRMGDDDGALDTMTFQMALLIGLIQCLALWPGMSRSLVTILGGLLVGLPLAAAVEFSFLLGLVTLGAATAYDTLKHGTAMLEAYGPLSVSVGFLASLLSAIFAVKWMVSYLHKHGLAIFGWYRILLALGVAAFLLSTPNDKSHPPTQNPPTTKPTSPHPLTHA